MNLIYRLPGIVLLLLIAGFLNGCILVVDEDLTDVCTDEPLPGDPIADIALVPGEAFERDLEHGRYPVFVRGDDYTMSYDLDVDDEDVVRARIRSGVLRVEARSTGSTRVYIRAYQSGCDDYYATTSFVVTVTRP